MIVEGLMYREARDPNGTLVWVAECDLNCNHGDSTVGLTCRSTLVLRDEMCRHVRRPECRVGPGELHSHRNPTVHEVRYLSLRYKVRIFCAERRSVAGIQYYIRELVQRYNLPWSQRDVYRSLRDVTRLCDDSGRVWRRTVPWYSPDSPERAAYLRRQEAGRARRAAHRLVFDERCDVVGAPESPVMPVVRDPATPPGSPVLEPVNVPPVAEVPELDFVPI